MSKILLRKWGNPPAPGFRGIWENLRTIPEGQTVYYSEVAKAIGRPKATRAVARACATNPVALVVPCHRVVPKSGGAGEYGWGRERKKELLELEKRDKSSSQDQGRGNLDCGQNQSGWK